MPKIVLASVKTPDPQQFKIFKYFYENNLPRKKIAEYFCMSTRTVNEYAKRYDLKRKDLLKLIQEMQNQKII